MRFIFASVAAVGLKYSDFISYSDRDFTDVDLDRGSSRLTGLAFPVYRNQDNSRPFNVYLTPGSRE